MSRRPRASAAAATWDRIMAKALAPRLVIIWLFAALAAGCSTPQRLAAVPEAQVTQADPGIGAIRFLVTRDIRPMAEEARAALQREQAWLASQGHRGELPPAHYLAISGGSDNGAFGAGLLNGWTAAGNRPVFKVVTGVSTGALSAPFAFLGSEYDRQLEQVYTTISQDDVYRQRGMLRGLFSDGMADSAPLLRMVERYVDQPLLDAIAAEYARGRLLLVATANLDSLDPVVWNMTAIAASRDPRARELFQRILLASASIPGVFPPVMIDVTVDGVRHQEMHVDGGTAAQVFLYPPSLPAALGTPLPPRQRSLYVIRNARLDADWVSVERRTLPIAARAVSSLLHSQGVGDLYRIYATAQRDRIDYNLAYIPATFEVPHNEAFNMDYMRQLFAFGRDLGARGYQWHKTPPGYEGPAG
jgi:hypothetical protein